MLPFEFTEGQSLFLIFTLIIGIILYIPAFIFKRKIATYFFSILSAMVFIFLGFELSEYTILLLVFIGVAIFQIVSLMFIGGNRE